MKMKILSLMMLCIFVSSSVLHSSEGISSKEIKNVDENSCFGFIVPIVKLENKTLENNIDCSINHMVNDFLREKIEVYWTAESSSISSSGINNSNIKSKFFEKGSFIVPFTDNKKVNTKIIAIIGDYNQSSEIEEKNNIPIYKIVESLNIKAHKLANAKIARYAGTSTHYTQFFPMIATQCGFLDVELLLPKDIYRLTLENFNVFIWPGGEPYMTGVKRFTIRCKLEEIIFNVMKQVRDFVGDGGGYVGSCYGSLKPSNLWITSSGKIWPHSLKIAGTIAITPEQHQEMTVCKQRIVDSNNPVVYGFKENITDFYGGGPKLICIENGANPITEYLECNDYLDGTSSWVSNNYRKGRVVSFSSHPEIMAFLEESYNGRQVVSNTYYHLSNKGLFDINFNENVNNSYIDKVLKNTKIVLINTKERDLFKDFREKLDTTNKKLNNLKIKIKNINSLLEEDFLSDYSQSFLENIISKINGGKNKSDGIKYSQRYIENITFLLAKIEKVYSNIKNNTDFSNDFKRFNKVINQKIKDINNLLEKSIKISKILGRSLIRYKNNKLLTNLKEISFQNHILKVRKQISESFILVTQMLHESLKFLRYNWYEYETEYYYDNYC